MYQIKSLDKTDFDVLYGAFNEAFSNYEVQINKEELRNMLIRRGFLTKLSFGAFDNNKLISFTLNGIGKFNSVNTAYDTGTGTIKEYRGKGIASEIFTYAIPFLKEAGISQYLLEVLQHNTKAVAVYKNLGFSVTREFNYYTQPNSGLQLLSKNIPKTCHIKEMKLHNIEQLTQFWDFLPSWQNSFEAIFRSINDFVITAAFDNQKLVGYCIFEPVSGDVTQIAIDKNHRRLGIASILLRESFKHNRNNSIKIINTETSCETMARFLESNGIPLKGKQFEMIKKI